MDIIVLAGGLSTERDVSFKTGSMVASALKENGHRVILLDVFMGYSDKEENLDGIFDRADEISVKVDDIPEVAPDLAAVKASRKDQSPCFFGPNVIRMCQMADIVFMALHGENGENGKLQAAFDLLGVKYTGSDYLSSAIAMNKGMAKQLFASAGIPAPRGIAMKKENREDDVTKLPLTLPCVVKPCCGGSSIGVTMAYQKGNPVWEKWNYISNNRLKLGYEAIVQYGFTWFGQKIRFIGASTLYYKPDAVYNYVDNAYLMQMLLYGTVFILVYCVLMSLLLYRLVMQNEKMLLMCVLISMVFGMANPQSMYLTYNPLLLLLVRENGTLGGIEVKGMRNELSNGKKEEKVGGSWKKSRYGTCRWW